ncbi:response regulator transcription factor [Sphingopyxis chilensis]
MIRTEEQDDAGHCVLLVDDDQAVRRSIKLLLRARGFSVHDFGSAVELLADHGRAPCRCLITDYLMPSMDGLALLARLQASGWSGPAILITGCYQKDLEKRALDAGFSALVEKPLTDEKLVGLIAQCLDKPPLQDKSPHAP